MSSKDIAKSDLYESVKALYDFPHDHVHLNQQKLYTLFSVAFNYFLYMATKEGGNYILRIQDSYLLEKLIKRAKDETSRKFLRKLALPRKLRYQNAVFYLDFFPIATWNLTNSLPQGSIKGALVVKNTAKLMMDEYNRDPELELEEQTSLNLPSDFFYKNLRETAPKTITIAFDEDYSDLTPLKLSIIKENPEEELARGVKVNMDLSKLED